MHDSLKANMIFGRRELRANNAGGFIDLEIQFQPVRIFRAANQATGGLREVKH